MSTPSPYLRPLPEEALLVRAWRGDAPLHLVGGAVRDWLLQRPLKDLDFALPAGAIPFARQVARRLDGAFFVLDAARDVARVILPAAPGRTVQVLDFAAYRGPDLEDDLRLRDFTVNALALDPQQPQNLVDPTGGLRDLKDRLLRLVYPRALQDDPLRVLRAVRLAVTLEFRLSPETRAALPQAAPLLDTVAAERRSEELFRILEHPRADAALRVLAQVDALAALWPEVDALRDLPPDPDGTRAWDQALRAVHMLHRLAQALAQTYDPEDAANFALGLVSWRLGRFRQALAAHWDARLHPYRSKFALAVWAAGYHNAGRVLPGPAADLAARSARLAEKRAQALRLSRAEVRYLGRIVRHHAAVLRWAAQGHIPSAREAHRFYRDAGEAGVDAVLVALAVALARASLAPPHAFWQQHVAVARALWEAWWEQHDQIVAPPPLLRGDEVTALVGRPPGPWVGQALRALREAQAAGEVT
ncbi:MAG: CCA tRNA nucleotidyltransferase, partial [Chloroflexi bacterium]|nr:CCA tRNA nucleotidyltransferase [Chloroflexota bacterium]